MFKKLFTPFLSVFSLALLMLGGCATAPKDVPGSMLVKGEMNYFAGDANCWVLETGNFPDKKIYQLGGDAEILKKVQISEAQVTVRILPRPEQKPGCRIATSAADLLEVLEVQER